MQDRLLALLRSMRLWPRMAFAISAGFLSLFIAFALLGERALQDSSDRILQERLVIAVLTARQFDQRISDALNTLSRTRNLATFDPGGSDLTAETHILRDTLASHPALRTGMMLLDTEGIVILAQPPDLYSNGEDLSGHPAIQPALGEANATLSSPYMHPSAGPVIAAVLPVWIGEEKLGYLIGLLSLKSTFFTEPLTQAAEISQTGHAVLFDSKGDVLASTMDLPFLSPGEHHSFYANVLAGGAPSVESVPFELEVTGEPHGHLHTMAAAPLSRAPWGVAVGGDMSEAFEGVRRLRVGLAFLSAVSLIATWGITLLGARALVRPVHRMTGAAQRIAGGQLNTPISAAEGGEIAVLAAALERMRVQLLQQIHEVEHWNQTLEHRVTERSRELQAQRERAQLLLQHAIRAQEEERGRLARELHDEIGQSLTAVRLSLEHLQRSFPGNDHLAHERFQTAEQTLALAIRDLRRIMAALRPGVLDELGLVPAVQWLADQNLTPHGVRVQIEAGDMHQRLSEEVEITLFRIAQEAFNNILRHSQARNVELRIAATKDEIQLAIQDDGRGFDPGDVRARADLQGNLGIAGMEERASLLGGQLAIKSQLGKGTQVLVVIPLIPEPADEGSV